MTARSPSAPPPPASPRGGASPLSRRRLLQLSAVAGVALAGGAALLARIGGDHYARLVPGGVRPVVLGAKELAILYAVCDRIVAASPGQPTARDARVAERVDRELAFHTAKMQGDVRAALMLVEHGGLLHGSGSRFTTLGADEQDAHLARMAEGNDVERAAFGALRTVALFFYYCDERTWPGVHYGGPLVPVRKAPEADSRPAKEA